MKLFRRVFCVLWTFICCFISHLFCSFIIGWILFRIRNNDRNPWAGLSLRRIRSSVSSLGRFVFLIVIIDCNISVESCLERHRFSWKYWGGNRFSKNSNVDSVRLIDCKQKAFDQWKRCLQKLVELLRSSLEPVSEFSCQMLTGKRTFYDCKSGLKLRLKASISLLSWLLLIDLSRSKLSVQTGHGSSFYSMSQGL